MEITDIKKSGLIDLELKAYMVLHALQDNDIKKAEEKLGHLIAMINEEKQRESKYREAMFIQRSVKPIGLQPMGCKRLTLSEDILTDGIWRSLTNRANEVTI
jgi:hypothetical protein